MSVPRRERASFVLLLVLAAGLAVAAAAAGASAPEMACCPAGMGMPEIDVRGCAWLGAGDCCPERPTAPAPSSAAPPAPASFLAPVLPPLRAAPAAAAACAFRLGTPPRSDVLRL